MLEKRYVSMSLDRGVSMMDADEPDRELAAELSARITAVRPEQEAFREWCERADRLYYPEVFTDGGADLWPYDPSATTEGRSHVSVNTPPVYVDVPAALQAVVPVENMLATDTTKEAREAASAYERIYVAWKAEEEFDLKFHKACTVKGLYGRTAGRVYWDKQLKRPCVEIVEQPRNLWFGYQTDSYERLEWAAYMQKMEPNAVATEFGYNVEAKDTKDGMLTPFLSPDPLQPASRTWLQQFGGAQIEVWDYWYRKARWSNGRLLGIDTWNVVIAGNKIVRGPTKYPEYKGDIPYEPLYNTFIPGMPNGRPELRDMEHLIREKYEKITAGSQMISGGTAGDYWQLVGAEAPNVVPANLKPVRNQIVAPGAGNRIESITPFIAQFQLEQYLGRLDRESTVVSGLSELLLGLIPPNSLSSSKAVNALIGNYETRLSMRRALLYAWRRKVWSLVSKVWESKDKDVALVIRNGGGVLDVTDPSLSPRDEMETATRAANLVAAKIWSQRRAMDATHVDDPQTEQDLIREESTDGTLNPERVMVMAQLLSTLQAVGQQPGQDVQSQAAGQQASTMEGLRQALGDQTADNTTSSQLPGDQGITPPIPGAAPEAGGAQPPFAAAPPAEGQTSQLQAMITNKGEAKGRILTQRQLGKRP